MTDDDIEIGVATNHPFIGYLVLDLTLVILGRAVTRRLRVEYDYCPPWPFFDEDAGAIARRPDGPSCSTRMALEGVPEGEAWVIEKGDIRKRPNDPVWERADVLNAPHVLPQEVWDSIDAAIDAQCRTEDQDRRRHRRVKRKR